MEKKLANIFKTTKVTRFIKFLPESSYIVLQVKSKSKTLKQPVYFLRAVEFWPTFDIQIEITLAIFWDKSQNHTFQKAQRTLSKCAEIFINKIIHYEITSIF